MAPMEQHSKAARNVQTCLNRAGKLPIKQKSTKPNQSKVSEHLISE